MRGEHGRVLAAGINHTRRSPRHVIPPTWSTTTRWWSRRAGRVFSDGTLSFRQTRYGGQRSLADLVDAPDLSCRPVRGVLTG